MPSDKAGRDRFKTQLMIAALDKTKSAWASSQGAASASASSQGGSLVTPQGAVKCVVGGDFNMKAQQVSKGMMQSTGEWQLSDDSEHCNQDFLFCSEAIRKVTFTENDGTPAEYWNFEKVHKLVGGELDVTTVSTETGAATSTLASPQGVVATGAVATGVVATSALAPSSQEAVAKAAAIMAFMQAKKTQVLAELVELAQARDERMAMLRQQAVRDFDRMQIADAERREADDSLAAAKAAALQKQKETDEKLRAATLHTPNVDELLQAVKRKAQELEQQEDEARVIAEGASASSRGTAQEAGVMAGVSASSQGYDVVMAGAGTFAPPQGAASPAQQVTVEEFVPDYDDTADHEEEEQAENDVSSVTMTMPSVMKIPKRKGRDGYVWSEQGAVEFIAKVLDCRCVVGVDMNLCDTAGFPPGTCVTLPAQRAVQHKVFTWWCDENPNKVAENTSRYPNSEKRKRNLRSRYRAAMKEQIGGTELQWQYSKNSQLSVQTIWLWPCVFWSLPPPRPPTCA